MKAKKTQKADLEGKKFIFTQIGLAVSLLVVFFIFEIKSYDERELIDVGREAIDVPEEIIPITEQKVKPPPPPPQKTQAPIIKVVEDDVEVEQEVEINAEVDQETIIEDAPIIEEESEPVEAEIFMIVEDEPQFPGGMGKLMKFLGNNIKYPMIAKESGIQGKVYLSFVVEPNGSISNIKILRGIGGGCDEEAVRVVKSMPKWKPGKQRGKAVRCAFNLPVVFKLQ
ncbi:MAG: energy transducer TonB [Hyphomicrobiales bacterium]